MWEQLQRFRSLEPAARKLFVRCVALLPWIAASLKTTGYRRTHARLERRLARLQSTPKGPQEAVICVARTCRMVRAAGHYGAVSPSCLESSLALWYLLRRQGIDSQIRIGVRKEKEDFEAHAWVEWNGTPLNQETEPHHHYAAFDAEFAKFPAERP